MEVERVAPPTPSEFRNRYLRPGHPVVIRGLTDDWPIRKTWTFSGLAARHGHRTVTVALTKGGVLQADVRSGVHYTTINFANYISRLSGPEHPGMYLATPLERFLPDLLAELDVPAYCRDAGWRRSRLWMNAAGTVSPLHRDIAHNLIVHLAGKKRFTLFHRNAWLYPYPLWSGMGNFSRFDPERSDYARFPRAQRLLRFEVILDPGDVLFLPSMWWHHARALERSLSVNFWWAAGWLGLAARAAESWKRLLQIDDMKKLRDLR